MTKSHTPIIVYGMYTAKYQVQAQYPGIDDGDELIEAVSKEHAVKIMLAAYLDVQEWVNPDMVNMFFAVGARDLYRMIPKLKYQVKYVWREVEA